MSETELSSPVAADPIQRRNRLIVLGLILITLACYWPVGKCWFINFDDALYVTENPAVLQGITAESIKYSFTTVDGNCWMPLTWLSHAANTELFGPTHDGHSLVGTLFHTTDAMPAGHHLTNLLIHLANIILLWHVLKRLTGVVWASAWVAAMFAIHPMHVESVAWIAERKDVLSTLFFLLTILAYQRYLERAGIGRYLLICLAFIASLMSKPMTVTTPCVLLLLDFWPLRRIQLGPDFWKSLVRPIGEKIPLMLLSVASCLITIFGTAANNGLIQIQAMPLPYRLETVITAYGRYIKKLFWPTNLSIFYPFPSAWPMSWVIGSCLLFAAVTVIAIMQVKRRPYVLVGWLWYVGTLVPVIGLIVTGDASLADRYTYLPYIGLFIIISWLGYEMTARIRPAIIVAGVLSIAACMAPTYHQVWYWQSSRTLMRHALDIQSDNWLANLNYGSALLNENHLDEEAAPYFKEAVRDFPNGLLTNLTYGRFLLDSNKVSEASLYLARIGRTAPKYPEYLVQVARMQAMSGQHAEAVKLLRYALSESPNSIQGEMYLAQSLAELGQIDEAELHFRRAIYLNPDLARAYHRLGLIAAMKNNPNGAIEDFKSAIRINPTLGIVHLDYGITLARLGRYDEALQELVLASTLLKKDELHEKSSAEMATGQVIEKLGHPLDAAQHYINAVDFGQQAVDADPTSVSPRYELAVTLKKLGRRDEAVVVAKKAMDLAAERQGVYFISQLKAMFPELPVPPLATTRPTTHPTTLSATEPAQNPK